MSAVRSTKLAARAWWALLPYAGETGYPNPDQPPRWFAYPLTWLWHLVGKLPSSAPFEPPPYHECNCDECRGVEAGSGNRPAWIYSKMLRWPENEDGDD